MAKAKKAAKPKRPKNALAMPDGSPLPASLASALVRNKSLVRVVKGKLAWRSFEAMVSEEFDDDTAVMFASYAKLITGQCLVLAGSHRFLYAGVPDKHGEYPVLVIDADELWVGLAYPSFDTYLADVDMEPMAGWNRTAWQAPLRAAAKRNFGGMYELDFQKPKHVDGARAATKAMAAIRAPHAEPAVSVSRAQAAAAFGFDPDDFR